MMRVIGDSERNFDRSRSNWIELSGVEVWLTEDPARVALLYAVLAIELPDHNTIVVLVNCEQAMIDLVQRDIPRVDVSWSGTVVS